eukprot:CAMPEP_0182460528 /NCGR_PEP_ID=MMETSP1319-20130603/5380_1 /TAXON_ID=172717 /ORGANISM="Bolidomonas pacifica, Strain RCC208" /LENGTH=55 /DNA_ID=CAMNT_0024659647 /DNA_START=237 /DNA_END=404 /DNA_ORIENTATION=+
MGQEAEQELEAGAVDTEGGLEGVNTLTLRNADYWVGHFETSSKQTSFQISPPIRA